MVIYSLVELNRRFDAVDKTKAEAHSLAKEKHEEWRGEIRTANTPINQIF